MRVLDDFSTGRRENLADVAPEVEIVEGDLRNLDAVGRAVQGVELVFHQGARPSVPRSVADPLTTNAINVEGTLNVLLAARDHGVRRVVFASSSSVYGENGQVSRAESMRPEPVSPYGVSKLAAEVYCGSFSRSYGLETVSLRYFNVFGPAQDPSSEYAAVVPRFIVAAHAGRAVQIYGDGRQTRDFTYVSDVVDAAIQAGHREIPSPSVLNVAAGGSTSVNELAAVVERVLGVQVERDYLPERRPEIKHSTADIANAQRMLGFTPQVSLGQGLERTAEALVGRSLAVG